MNRWRDAKRAFEQAIVVDGDNAIAHHGLGLALLRMKKYTEAAEELLTAIGLFYHFPIAHYHFGEALLNLDYFERAAEAFTVCVSQSPGIKKAHLQLAELYKYKLNEPEKAKEHERFSREMIKPD